jgi:arylsulfatase A-like enzyme
VLADDLDMPSMPELDSLASIFRRDGATFSQAYATHPLCSPSRASLLTGMYTHNHGILDNVPPAGGYPAFRRHEAHTIATLLQDAGYRTALIGKYLNSYPEDVPTAEAIPPGWDRWFAHLTSVGGDRYLNYWINDQGTHGFRGSNPEDYSTDLLAALSEEFLDDAAQRESPFFLFVSVEAPHIHPVTAADRHAMHFLSSRAPRLPSFNEEDVSDKPAFVQNAPLLDDSQIRKLDILQRGRLRTMLAVEDLIRRLLAKLEATGDLGRTYLIFTSDNGFCMGVHRMYARKRNFFEESIHVPLMVRGPGVVQGRTLDALVELIDIPATLADLAGLSGSEAHDGRSLRSLLTQGVTPASWREDVLVEFYPSHMSYALRTPDHLYTELSALERELYDMRRDPYQLDNLIRVADPELLERLSARLAERRACRGAGCRQ